MMYAVVNFVMPFFGELTAMASLTEYEFTRYLSAKKSVDDRALNQPVWECLKMALDKRPSEPPLQVLEIGAGIGTMIERSVERGLLTKAHYTAIDADNTNIELAYSRLSQWATQQGYTVTASMAPIPVLPIPARSPALAVQLETADLFAFAQRPEQQQRYDLLIAHAFLDLVDIPRALPLVKGLLKPNALFYGTINFDGATILQPEIDPAFDSHIERLYHQTMDERLVNGQPSGDSQSGRHLFGHLRAAGVEILAAGASDWVVFGTSDPTPAYPQDEAYFLHFIIHTMQGALQTSPHLDQVRFAAWIAERHAQIERGELVYIAHQLDFLGQLGK